MHHDDQTWRDLDRRLAELLGPEPVDTLLPELTPTSWGDVATRKDLDDLAELWVELARHQLATQSSMAGALRVSALAQLGSVLLAASAALACVRRRS